MNSIVFKDYLLVEEYPYPVIGDRLECVVARLRQVKISGHVHADTSTATTVEYLTLAETMI